MDEEVPLPKSAAHDAGIGEDDDEDAPEKLYPEEIEE